eukprot:TRINITY_DN24781_c0_g1_i1.p1 TRINITY_DN24781_c0_g1~~TRINITY_DN24781_c0_g1_i1.p1  ORF type:complete len:439 (+),score=48.27 TRINITY_DN24781_c0_g1_i1:102-1418(+)
MDCQPLVQRPPLFWETAGQLGVKRSAQTPPRQRRRARQCRRFDHAAGGFGAVVCALVSLRRRGLKRALREKRGGLCVSCTGNDNEKAAPDVSEKEFHVAPMVKETTPAFRRLLRCGITREATLWTEMCESSHFLSLKPRQRRSIGFDNKTVLQLFDSRPRRLAYAAAKAAELGVKELNLNCGCPSSLAFHDGGGIVLMKSIRHTTTLLREMVQAASPVPVSVKCRLGLREGSDPGPLTATEYEYLAKWITAVAEAGVKHFVVHARIGLSDIGCEANRVAPPLQTDMVFRLAEHFPELKFTLNGGISSLSDAKGYVSSGSGVRSVMAGRAVRDTPFAFQGIDQAFYDRRPAQPAPLQIIKTYLGGLGKGLLPPRAAAEILVAPRHLYAEAAGGPRFAERLVETATSLREAGKPVPSQLVVDTIMGAVDELAVEGKCLAT